VFAWQQWVGAWCTALGALAGGLAAKHLGGASTGFRALWWGYTLGGGVLLVLFSRLSPQVETARLRTNAPPSRGLHRSRRIVLTLSALFAVDSFGSGLVLQSLLALWLHKRFHADVDVLGGVLFGANTLAAMSAFLSVRLARRFGLIRTMVFTHVPACLLLIAFPFMPTLPLAIACLFARYLLAQMDVPARSSFVMNVVAEDERSAANSWTSHAKVLGNAVGPWLAGTLGVTVWPFVIAGVLKVGYDLTLYWLFARHEPRGHIKT
jgi:predicted MFS family arabinose efflux permease